MEATQKQASAAHVTLGSLVDLHKAARSLPAFPQAIKASSGDSYLSPFRGRGMEYDESTMSGPPFNVPWAEVSTLFDHQGELTILSEQKSDARGTPCV